MSPHKTRLLPSRPSLPCPLDTPVWRWRLHLRFTGRTGHRRPAARAPLPARKAHAFQYGVRYDFVNVDAGYRPW